MATRNRWIWGISGTIKYAVKDLTEIQLVENYVNQNFQVVARKRIGWEKVLLKEFPKRIDGQKYINETFPTR